MRTLARARLRGIILSASPMCFSTRRTSEMTTFTMFLIIISKSLLADSAYYSVVIENFLIICKRCQRHYSIGVSIKSFRSFSKFIDEYNPVYDTNTELWERMINRAFWHPLIIYVLNCLYLMLVSSLISSVQSRLIYHQNSDDVSLKPTLFFTFS